MRYLMTLPDEDRLLAVEEAFADRDRLNKLQALLERRVYSGTMLVEYDEIKGLKLQESVVTGSDSEVRGAIDRFLAEFDPEEEILE